MPLELTKEETQWRDELERQLSQFRIGSDFSERKPALSEMQSLAERLHNSLSKRGHAPIHHKYMIKNRGMEPDNPEFYMHIHPIQDLIKFTYDPHANDDPEDVTLGVEFDFCVYSRRWGHDDKYIITRTAGGWFLKGIGIEGPCDKSGHPVITHVMDNDCIQYPCHIEYWFEWLWQKAQDHGLSKEEVQQGFNDIANWINLIERNTPSGGIWRGLV